MEAVSKPQFRRRAPGVCPPDVPRLSIYVASLEEIAKHRWIQGVLCGRDPGDAPVNDWIQKYWWGYLRAKWMEHLRGTIYWHELDDGDFGLLNTEFTEHKSMLNEIVQRLVDGAENLSIIKWAIETEQDLDVVISILEALDINSRRLVHKFDPR